MIGCNGTFHPLSYTMLLQAFDGMADENASTGDGGRNQETMMDEELNRNRKRHDRSGCCRWEEDDEEDGC